MRTTEDNKRKILSQKFSGRAEKKQRELATWMQAQSGRLSVPLQKKLFILFTIVASAFFILIIVGALKSKGIGAVGNITVPSTEHRVMQDSSKGFERR